MRKSLLLSTCLAAAFATPAGAESWYMVSVGDQDLVLADADSLARNGNYLQMDVIDSMENPVPFDGTDVYYLRGPINFDCNSRRFQSLSKTALDLDHAQVTDVDGDSSWQAVVDGSHGDALFQFACDGSLREQAAGDPFDYAENYWYYYYGDDSDDANAAAESQS